MRFEDGQLIAEVGEFTERQVYVLRQLRLRACSFILQPNQFFFRPAHDAFGSDGSILGVATRMRKTLQRIRKAGSALHLGGPQYLVLLVRHWVIHRTLRFVAWAPLDKRLRAILSRTDTALISHERKKSIAEVWTITSRQRFTIAKNREWWNRHDWSNCGEEWTPSGEWKTALVNRFLNRFVPQGGTAVEIGPGAGRWTEFLADRCGTLHVIDVSERALEICRSRFSTRTNIRFLLTARPQIAVPDSTVDAIWSYDVFVHINPVDTRSYFGEFRRVLKVGGHVVIHHPGAAPPDGQVRPGTRSDLTDEMVLAFARENDFALVDKTAEFVNPGDVLSVFRKAEPGGRSM